MQIELTTEERDLLLEALDVVIDLTIDTKRDLPPEEVPGQEAYITQLTNLDTKLKSVI